MKSSYRDALFEHIVLGIGCQNVFLKLASKITILLDFSITKRAKSNFVSKFLFLKWFISFRNKNLLVIFNLTKLKKGFFILV